MNFNRNMPVIVLLFQHKTFKLTTCLDLKEVLMRQKKRQLNVFQKLTNSGRNLSHSCERRRDYLSSASINIKFNIFYPLHLLLKVEILHLD